MGTDLRPHRTRRAGLGALARFVRDRAPRDAVTADRVLRTILVTDLVGSTGHAAVAGDAAWRGKLDAHDALVRRQLARFHGQEVKTLGDGILAVFDGPCRAIRCAHAITDGMEALGLRVRAGVHTGEVERRGVDIAGLAVHISARIAALARPDEVLVSGVVPHLVVGSDLTFSDRGDHELRGVPGRWQLYTALPTSREVVPEARRATVAQLLVGMVTP